MDPQGTKPAPQCSVASLVASCALLAAVLAPVAGLLAWYGHSRSGMAGLWAALIAGLVCWGASAAALVSTFVGQKLNAGVQGLLVGILLRTGLPLAAGILLQAQGGPLAEAGIFAMILGLYLCSLAAETLLAVRLIPATKTPSSAISHADGA